MKYRRSNPHLTYDDIAIEPDQVVHLTNKNGDVPTLNVVQIIELFKALDSGIGHEYYLKETPSLSATIEYAYDVEEEAKKYR